MKTVNTLVEKLYKESKHRLVEKIGNHSSYKELLKNLIVQGLIKLMEPEVTVRCRKSDIALVESVFESAIEDYKAVMKKEVKHFHDKDVPIKILMDKAKYLPEYDENET